MIVCFKKKFFLQRPMNFLRDLKDVGYLQIKLIKATDLPSTDISGTYLNEIYWHHVCKGNCHDLS